MNKRVRAKNLDNELLAAQRRRQEFFDKEELLRNRTNLMHFNPFYNSSKPQEEFEEWIKGLGYIPDMSLRAMRRIDLSKYKEGVALTGKGFRFNKVEYIIP